MLSAKTKIAENTFPVGQDLKQICVFAFYPEDEVGLDQNAAKTVFLRLRENGGLNEKVAMLDLRDADYQGNKPNELAWFRGLSNVPSAPLSAVDRYLKPIFPSHVLIYNKETICGLSSEDRALMSTLLLVFLRYTNNQTEVFSRTPAELWLMIADKLLQPVTVEIKESKEKESSAVVSGAGAGAGAAAGAAAAAEAGAEAEESAIVAGSKAVSLSVRNKTDVNTTFWNKSTCRLKITASLFKGEPPQKRTETVGEEKRVLIAPAC